MIDAKPVKRHKATKQEWAKIQAAFEFACCISCGLPNAEHLHHIAFKKADRGDDVIENLAPMCRACHTAFHARAHGWERIAGHIRSYVMARESRLGYVLDKIGLERFARRYPEPTWLSLGDLAAYQQPDALLREET